MDSTLIRDTLTNCAADCALGSYGEGTWPATLYARGIVKGIVSTLMAQGKSFQDALAYVKANRPVNGPHGSFVMDSLPPAWREDWEKVS